MLNKSITLTGEKDNYRKTIIKSNNKAPYTIALVNNSIIRDLYIQDGETGINFRSGTICNCQIMNNYIGIEYEFGLLGQQTCHNELRNNKLINNEIGINYMVYNANYNIYAYNGWSDVNYFKNIQVKKSFSLSQNYPNPFNPVTAIKYTLSKSNYVIFKIFNLSGQEMKL